jgi:hypothetical protein
MNNKTASTIEDVPPTELLKRIINGEILLVVAMVT